MVLRDAGRGVMRSIVIAALSTACAVTHAPAAGSERELIDLETRWGDAVVKNDADEINRFVDGGWVVIDPEGRTIDRASFLDAIRSGTLRHEAMILEAPRVRVYGDAAVVTGRATSRGRYAGSAFSTHEVSTDVFVRRDGRWRCVLTQLTSVPGATTR